MRAALGSLPRDLRREWQRALAETRPAWQSAYYRQPAPQPFQVLAALPGDDEPWMS